MAPDSADIVTARERVAELLREPGFAEQLSRGFAEQIREHESGARNDPEGLAQLRRMQAALPGFVPIQAS